MADPSFVANLNKQVQAFFKSEGQKLSYDQASFLTDYPDKSSYIYSALLKTKGQDIIKLSNLRNPLADWDRPGDFGGYTRGIAFNPIKPMNAPTLANGSSPDPFLISKPDILATYHPLRMYVEFGVSQFVNQLNDAFNNAAEVGNFLANIMDSLSAGSMDTVFRVYKQVMFKFWEELNANQQTALACADIPATDEITTTEIAKKALNIIRNYVTNAMFGNDKYNKLGFYHAVAPEETVLYIVPELANLFTDMIVIGNYSKDTVTYTNIAANLSAYLGIKVKVLDDLGGRKPFDAAGNELFPIFTADGAVTGTYAASDGDTTPVDVATWKTNTNYPFRALLTESEFGLAFANRDTINAIVNPRGGGYVNTFRCIDKNLYANPACNTIYFK